MGRAGTARYRMAITGLSPAQLAGSGSRGPRPAAPHEVIPVKAVRVHDYGKPPSLDEVPEPTIDGPWDVLVHVGAAGVCRTDLHIIEGQWAEKSQVRAALHDRPRERRLGRGGRQRGHATSPSGDKVILHPLVTCGLCRGVPGRVTTCTARNAVPGHQHATAGWPSTCATRRPVRRQARRRAAAPADVAALADAGPHRLPRGAQGSPRLYPGTHARGDRRRRPRAHRAADARARSPPARSSSSTASEKALELAAADRRAPHRPGRRRPASSRGAWTSPAAEARRRLRLRRRARRRDGQGVAMTAAGRRLLRHRLRRQRRRPDHRHHLDARSTSSATWSAPTTTWPS